MGNDKKEKYYCQALNQDVTIYTQVFKTGLGDQIEGNSSCDDSLHCKRTDCNLHIDCPESMSFPKGHNYLKL